MLGRVFKGMLRGAVEELRGGPHGELVARFAVPLPPRSVPSMKDVPTFFGPTFRGVKNSELFAAKARELTGDMAPGFHFADSFITWARNNSMLDDKLFVTAWSANVGSPVDHSVIWRRYVLACAAFHCVQLDGAFVECGANAGVGVKTVVDYLGGPEFPKEFWAYDLFDHTEDMTNHAMPEHAPDLFSQVQAKFAGYPQVHVIQGAIPGSLEGNSPPRIAYLHIDMNQASAEVAALDVLFERMVPGGILILDDYEWSFYRDQKLAEDDWFDKRGYRVMPLPTGQGLVIKR
jgi:O-methyltransferase